MRMIDADQLSNVTRLEVTGAIAAMCESIGVSHFAYLTRINRIDRPEKIEVISNYPQDWADHYISSGYESVDPTISSAAHSFMPVDWRGLDHRCGDVRNFFGEASDFGLPSFGMTIPIRDRVRGFSAFSICVPESSRTWGKFIEDRRADLMHLGHIIHDWSRSAYDSIVMEDVSPLSNREVEVLGWAARGKTSWEIGQIVGLSKQTVDAYMKNVCKKLSVTNKTQAVAVAMAHGLIRL